jgi:hypothetical protein
MDFRKDEEKKLRGVMKFILVPSLVVTMILLVISAVQAAAF